MDYTVRLLFHFVDFHKAFDCVHRDTAAYGILNKIIRIRQVLDEETQYTVKIGTKTMQTFKVKTRVRQGCMISTFLFQSSTYLGSRFNNDGYMMDETYE